MAKTNVKSDDTTAPLGFEAKLGAPPTRWQHLKASAPQPSIGTLVDDAMAAIERDNPLLEGVLPKDFSGTASCHQHAWLGPCLT
jgi:hypothetical protein